MDDSDFEIEDSVEDSPFFQNVDIFSEFDISIDLLDSASDISIWEDDRYEESDQELELEEFVLNFIEQLQRDEIPIQLTLMKKTNTREIYYRDVALFKNQTVVNDVKLIELITHTLGVPRKSLNVRASAKGLFCGSGLRIGLKRGDTIQGTDSEGLLIPPSEEIAWLKTSENIAWVLVVEKEGKGYPDFATLELTRQLSLMLPESVPIGAIMDCDPYGLEIFSMYKFGGGARDERFATSRIECLGVWTSEILSAGIHRDSLLPLTKHDTKKVGCLSSALNTSYPLYSVLGNANAVFPRYVSSMEARAVANDVQSSKGGNGDTAIHPPQPNTISRYWPRIRFLVPSPLSARKDETPYHGQSRRRHHTSIS
ncbi:hypothetical protein Clacol_000691 [Clathrus columnatus]|uniref:DNA topoisomerase (ATP-hydrolyzing) n=1 Tax=Clathrus columnatus TaxID=1419009 RepID=A0AAV4ZZP9_9AGAM|nr:hypothetical protein Clacol_000691 [Clathrus columnatus]